MDVVFITANCGDIFHGHIGAEEVIFGVFHSCAKDILIAAHAELCGVKILKMGGGDIQPFGHMGNAALGGRGAVNFRTELFEGFGVVVLFGGRALLSA